MKRIFAIIMLVLFLLNVLGYYGIFVGLRHKKIQELVQKLDDNTYRESEAITFNFPITLPYYSDSKEFERVDGEFVHDGEVYRLVKQRYLQDTLQIVCVKDNESKKINQALTDYVKTFTDNPGQSQQSAKTLQVMIKDFIPFAISLNTNSQGWSSVLDYSATPKPLFPSYLASVVHPPERA